MNAKRFLRKSHESLPTGTELRARILVVFYIRIDMLSIGVVWLSH
jgi:hypothetical protein